uniref:ATP synthase complex subunit 8 n=1 Tax=Heloderma alvarezi TaxID=3146630 RepID=D5KWD8_9SAUR|nr:ATPase-8 [Heloderma horridum alvarezi]ADE18774.1 ATPase-8 [Heloderma horridum alvarezi]
MPQLMTPPWFYTLLLAWIFLLIPLFTKVLHVSNNNPMMPLIYKHQPNYWIWPWH